MEEQKQEAIKECFFCEDHKLGDSVGTPVLYLSHSQFAHMYAFFSNIGFSQKLEASLSSFSF
jgi:hypothetical protein